MKYFLILFVVSAGCLFVISGRGEAESKSEPHRQVQVWFSQELNGLIGRLEHLEYLVGQGAGLEEVQGQFVNARLQFKKIEPLLFYLDPEQFNLALNGAPLPKLQQKVPGIVVLDPKGFQRIEELLFGDETGTEEITSLTAGLRSELERIQQMGNERLLIDPVIFEAVRYGLIRINTLGLTGFDSPGDSGKALKECASSLEGIRQIMESYRQYISDPHWADFGKLTGDGIQQLQAGEFDSFDRAAFHREVLDPLWTKTLEIQRQLQIELPEQRGLPARAVGYAESGLFDPGFLRAEYYAEYTNGGHDTERIALGRLLFFDPVLSTSNDRACASCHRPDKAFTDGFAASLVTGTREQGKRNAPTLINSIYAEKFFHDLRADRLSAQMDHVVFNPKEFAVSYDTIVSRLRESSGYRKLFAEAYGTEGITRNTVTNAVTRYVASLRSCNSPFDRYMRRETDKIDPEVLRGYNLFAGKAGCATCHFAPTFAGLVPPFYTENESEVLGVPETKAKPYRLDDDQGRYMNGILTEQAPFYRYSFKTPTLRNIALTGPYMHNGVFSTLDEVVEFYNDGGGAGNGMEMEFQTLPSDSLKLTKREQKDLIRFMQALTDTVGLTAKPAHLPQFEGRPDLNRRTIGGRY